MYRWEQSVAILILVVVLLLPLTLSCTELPICNQLHRRCRRALLRPRSSFDTVLMLRMDRTFSPLLCADWWEFQYWVSKGVRESKRYDANTRACMPSIACATTTNLFAMRAGIDFPFSVSLYNVIPLYLISANFVRDLSRVCNIQ